MNLLAIDPGATAGYAFYTQETGFRWGVWKNPADKPRGADKRVLWNGTRYRVFLNRVRRVLRDHEIEGVCLEYNPMPDRSDDNAMLIGGWRAMIELALDLERGQTGREIFGPLLFSTWEWRSAYWGKYTMPPKEWDTDRKRSYHKNKALQACADEGWEVSSDDEAEALLMLVAFRKKMDPSFAFGRGGDAKAHQMGLAL